MKQLYTKQCSCNYMIIIITFYFWIAGQSVSNWGAWGECSKDCDGEQTRTRECFASTPCEKLEDKRKCSTSRCFSKYHLHKLTAVASRISRAITLLLFNESRERERAKSREQRFFERQDMESASIIRTKVQMLNVGCEEWKKALGG